MPYDITDGAQTHRLQLEGREKLTVSGVEDVSCTWTGASTP